MKKFLCFAGTAAIVAAAACSMMACGGESHHWGDWQRSETEHWRVCTDEGCDAEQRGAHKGEPCRDCGAGAKILSFGFTEGGDSAHADFAKEANVWFSAQAEENFFTYDFAGNDWNQLNEDNLANYDMVIFLNNIPNTHEQWSAFRDFVENGGAWMGFHSSAFAMWSVTPATEDTSWYNNEFLRCGEYGNRPYEDGSGTYWNTWNPTSEPLTVETHEHYATKFLPDVFESAPCEWYAWEKDLLSDPEVTVLITLNPTPENPAGDNPNKASEIWTSGHHPIAWANNNYKMVYMNWGHNLQSYNDFEKESETFSCPEQCQFVLDSLFGLVTAK